ncbi:hypothetical protein DFJ73DRAFT_892734 [Zopfochytrium polystomum]|nr:hypothetical protein DFJ73DRAFT_892734 [Zopfochytrium polystomum]
MHLASILKAVASAAALVLASASAPSSATVCGSKRDGQICMSAQCTTGNGVWLKTTPLITGIELANFDLQFTQNQAYALASSKGVKISISLPDSLSNLYLGFTKVSSTIGVGLPGGQPVGSLTVTDVPATGDSTTKTVGIDLNNVVFAPVASDAATIGVFEQVFQAITLKSGAVPLGMSGVATNSANISDVILPGMDATDVCLENVQFSVTSSLIGLGGLAQTTITGVPKLVGGDPATGLKLTVPIQIVNPSTITLKLNSDVTLDLRYNGSTIGSVVLPNFSLGLGTNTYSATGFLHPDLTNAASVTSAVTVIQNFVAGTKTDVAAANGRAAGLPALDLALGSLNIAQTLPGNDAGPLIQSGVTYVSTLADGADGNVPFLSFLTRITAFNPFDTTATIVNISSTIYFENTACLVIESLSKPFAIPAKTAVQSPLILTKLPNSVDGPTQCTSDLLTALLSNPSITVDTVSKLTISVGGYGSAFGYSLPGVSINIDFDTVPTDP